MHWQSVAEAERRGHGVGGGEAAGGPLILALREQVDALQAELDELEPVIGAAVLAATAFRLRDQDGLVMALRGLVRGLARLDHHRPAAAVTTAAAESRPLDCLVEA